GEVQGLRERYILRLQFLVEGDQLLVGRLQLFLRRLKFFVETLQLFVCGQRVCGGGLALLFRYLVVFNNRQKASAHLQDLPFSASRSDGPYSQLLPLVQAAFLGILRRVSPRFPRSRE